MLSKTRIDPAMLESSDKSNAAPVVGSHLTSLTLPGKPESVVSFTSQCSYSSTIVHVGDKKTQPELGIVPLYCRVEYTALQFLQGICNLSKLDVKITEDYFLYK